MGIHLTTYRFDSFAQEFLWCVIGIHDHGKYGKFRERGNLGVDCNAISGCKYIVAANPFRVILTALPMQEVFGGFLQGQLKFFGYGRSLIDLVKKDITNVIALFPWGE